MVGTYGNCYLIGCDNLGFFDIFRRKKELRSDSVSVTEISVDEELRRILGVKLSADVAMNIPAVAAAVNFIAGKVAELPVRLYCDDLDGKTKEITDDYRLTLLNDDTGDLLDPYQMKAAVVRDMLLFGGGYIYPEIHGNSFVALHYIDRNKISWMKNTDPIYKDARCIIGDHSFFHDEIIRVCRHTKDGVTGFGVPDENADILETAYKEILFEKYLVKKGGNKKGFLQAERKVAQEVLDDIRQKWETFYANNESSMLVLNDGLKFVESSNTSVEMQLNESIKRNNNLILQIFSLSDAVVSGTANDDQYVTAIKTAVIPVIDTFQSALNTGLLLPSEKKRYYWQFDLKKLLKGDILKRYQAYSCALKDGWLQKNEVRYEEDYEPYDFNFITLNLSDVLLDMDNKTLYTPNTNQAVHFGDGNGISLDNPHQDDIMEKRDNDESHYKQNPETGKMEGSEPYADKVTGGTSGSSSSGSGKSPDTIKLDDIQIFRSVGAKAKNYDVLDLQTGEKFHFVEGTKIQDVEVFAGKGVKTPYRNAWKFANKYGGKEKDWQHVKGKGILDFYGESRRAEVHWSRCAGIGNHEFFIKRWLD